MRSLLAVIVIGLVALSGCREREGVKITAPGVKIDVDTTDKVKVDVNVKKG